MKIISMPIQKGGTGKTSISVSLAVELAKKYNVLFIDCDTQGNSTGWLLREEFNFEFADYFYGTKLCDVIQKTKNPNLDVIGTFSIGGKLQAVKDGEQLKENIYMLTDFFDDVVKNYNYDFCIIDTAPTSTLFEKRLYCNCDEVIPPLTLECFSVDGLQIFLNNLNLARKNMRSEKPLFNKIVLNKFDKRYSSQKNYLNSFNSLAGQYSFYQVPVDPVFVKAQNSGFMLQEIKETKKETLSELSRLANDIAKEA